MPTSPHPGRRPLALCLGLCSLLLGAAAAAAPTAWVAQGSASVGVVDAGAGTLTASVPVGGSVGALATSRDGTRVYAAVAANATVEVLDGLTHVRLATWTLPSAAQSLAVSPDGTRLWAMGTDGVLQAVDTATGAVVASATMPAAGSLAAHPDGARLYLAAGGVQVIDTATLTVTRSVPLSAGQGALHVAIGGDGRTAWVAHTSGLFTGGVLAIDTATDRVTFQVPLGSIPGRIAATPDGGRAYVAIAATWVDTGYGAGFMPGRSVTVIDGVSRTAVAGIDLGADGSSWTQQNTAAGLAVTPDRASLVIAVPRLAQVVVVPVNAPGLRTPVATSGSPGVVTTAAAGAAWLPYAVDAVADSGGATTLGGTAVANVLTNDTYGGIVPTVRHVTLTQRASSHPGVTLDTRSGAVRVAAGTAAGSYTLTYRACNRLPPKNCDEAQATVTVTVPRTVLAADDAASPYPDTAAALYVLTNDRLGDLPATVATATLTTLSSSQTGVTLDAGSGSVRVAAGTPTGTHTLRYRLCETAVPANCDDATVTLNVVARAVVAADDPVTAARTGGRILTSVLANDTLAGLPATTASTTLAALGASHPGLSLDTTDGAVNLAAGTPAGSHTLSYRLCERSAPANCDDATVQVTVLPYAVVAVDDSARGASKRANTPLPSVLTNDSFAGSPARVGTVTLTQVSLTPATPRIRLDTTDGSVDVLGEVNSGSYRLVYRLCEAASPDNCDEATVTLDLSGGD